MCRLLVVVWKPLWKCTENKHRNVNTFFKGVVRSKISLGPIFVWFCSGKKQCPSQAVYFNISTGNFWTNYPFKETWDYGSHALMKINKIRLGQKIYHAFIFSEKIEPNKSSVRWSFEKVFKKFETSEKALLLIGPSHHAHGHRLGSLSQFSHSSWKTEILGSRSWESLVNTFSARLYPKMTKKSLK